MRNNLIFILIKNFFKRYISKDEEIISLNSITSDSQELIDEIADVDGANIIVFDKFNISVNDEEFLKRFIQKGRLLTEVEVVKSKKFTGYIYEGSKILSQEGGEKNGNKYCSHNDRTRSFHIKYCICFTCI